MFRKVILAFLILTNVAQAEIKQCTREMFTHCLPSSSQFIADSTNFTYSEKFLGIYFPRTIKVKRQVGCLSHFVEACSLSALRNDANRIPTAALAAEHFWMLFNVQQRGQAELLACWKSYEEIQKLLRQRCLVTDERCSTPAITIKNIANYWIEFNAPEGTRWWDELYRAFGGENVTPMPPTKEDYIAHINIGINGLDFILAHREYCRNVALPNLVKQLKRKYRIR